MPNKNSQKGYRGEHSLVVYFRDKGKEHGEGDYNVIRSAGSKGPVDLILIHKAGGLIFMQVKNAAGPYISKDSRAALIDWAQRAGAAAILAYKQNRTWNFRQLNENGYIEVIL